MFFGVFCVKAWKAAFASAEAANKVGNSRNAGKFEAVAAYAASAKAEDKSDLIDYDYYYDEDNYLDYYDYRDLLEKMDVSGSEQVLINQRPSGPSQSEKQRLAFVHYVYPETSKQDQHFKEFISA